MIIVDKSRLSTSYEWRKKAERALREVEVITDKQERLEAINSRSAIWKELKESLAELSYDKCWYCESREIRSHKAVDHFRPKGKIAERNDHDGYWWLSFDPSNYRYSCTYCNSPKTDESTGHTGGKSCHFPLVREEDRAMCPSDDYRREYPMLLDPTDDSDPRLLWFRTDGECVPSCDNSSNPLGFQQADASIKIYHLNHQDIKEARLAVYERIIELLRRADGIYKRLSDTDIDFKNNFRDVLKDIKDMVARSAEYSSAAKAALYASRSPDRPWLDDFLRTIPS